MSETVSMIMRQTNYTEKQAQEKTINSQIASIVTPTVVKDSILATVLMKVYHHGFDS